MDEEQLYDIFEGVYIGKYLLDRLPTDLYIHYAGTLQKGVNKGFKTTLSKATLGTEEWQLLNHFRENINVFCGARTFQEIRDFQNFILDSTGALRPFNDYLNDVKRISDIYGKSERYPNWLQTEYNTTVSQGQSARKWMDIEKNADVLPYLRYVTQKDARVREAHADLEGFTARYDSDYWSSIYPPNGWNCRCFVEQLSEANETSKEEISEMIDKINAEREDKIKSLKTFPEPLFRMNSAKDRYIFKTEGTGAHPYFKVGEAYEIYKYNNFGFGTSFMI